MYERDSTYDNIIDIMTIDLNLLPLKYKLCTSSLPKLYFVL